MNKSFLNTTFLFSALMTVSYNVNAEGPRYPSDWCPHGNVYSCRALECTYEQCEGQGYCVDTNNDGAADSCVPFSQSNSQQSYSVQQVD
jgi:hypothetical protein